MNPIPTTPADHAVLTFEVKADGRAISNSFQILSVETWRAVNSVPTARIVLLDGSASAGTFAVSDLDTFLPGRQIEIGAGYGGVVTRIFAGVVTAHRIEISQSAASTLVVDIADVAIKMTVSRKTRVFEGVTDGALIGQLISADGLAADVSKTTTKHETVVQYFATDWDMLLLRAEMNGLLVTVDAGLVSAKAPDTSQPAVLKVAYGASMLDFRAELDAVREFSRSAVKSRAWDSRTQQVIESGPGNVSVSEAGNVSSAELAKVCALDAVVQLTGAPVGNEVLEGWSSAMLQRSMLAKLRGSVRFQGNALVKPGAMIELAGVGGRFSGNVFVTAVHHEIREGQWFTTATFGLDSASVAETLCGGVETAAGQLPSVQGLQSGIVTQVAEDPAGEFRVRVRLPLTESETSIWARLSSFSASRGAGAAFFPEVGDEVIVGFMNEDPRFPVVLGSVYSSTLAPPYQPDLQNSVKGIVTRSKLEVSFDETQKIITIRTPGRHVITLNDTSGEISIADSHKNAVTLGTSGITVDSTSDLVLRAKGDVTITAGGNLAMQATSAASLGARQVDLKAQTTLLAEGRASADLRSSGVVTVNGALVKIN